jgi:hypothetical protein
MTEKDNDGQYTVNIVRLYSYDQYIHSISNFSDNNIPDNIDTLAYPKDRYVEVPWYSTMAYSYFNFKYVNPKKLFTIIDNNKLGYTGPNMEYRFVINCTQRNDKSSFPCKIFQNDLEYAVIILKEGKQSITFKIVLHTGDMLEFLNNSNITTYTGGYIVFTW